MAVNSDLQSKTSFRDTLMFYQSCFNGNNFTTDSFTNSVFGFKTTLLFWQNIRDTVEPLHNGHLGDRRKWPLWRGGRYGEVGV